MPWRFSAGSFRISGASGSERQSQEGTPSSGTRRSRAGTPALRKYFCARTSVATWLHASGTTTPSHSNTTLPSGSTIREVRSTNRMPA
jgi:hypothetical protein